MICNSSTLRMFDYHVYKDGLQAPGLTNYLRALVGLGLEDNSCTDVMPQWLRGDDL